MEQKDDVPLDEIDLRLLRSLQLDASLSNQALAAQTHTSAPTALRRVRYLRELGVIERQVAILQPDHLKAVLGAGLTALIEVSLLEQTQEMLEAFEARAISEDAVQQCYRVSPGPDFMLVVQVRDMPAYQALASRLFTQDAQVRNVKAFFCTRRAKFSTTLAWL